MEKENYKGKELLKILTCTVPKDNGKDAVEIVVGWHERYLDVGCKYLDETLFVPQYCKFGGRCGYSTREGRYVR